MKTTEEEVSFAAPDKKKIYATLGYPARKTKSIVLFVHGLTSTALWPTMLLGSWFFHSKGFAYCRVNLYDWRPGARTLMTSDLMQHSLDVNTAVKNLKRRGFTKIYGVGHSFGGLTLLQADTRQFTAMSLWDPSSFISWPPERWFAKDRTSGAIYMKGSYEVLMSKRYINGIRNFPNELKLISKIKTPTQICYAAGPEGILGESSKRYFENLKSEKELVAVPGASHSFTEKAASSFLHRKTLRFFSRH